MEGTRCGCVHGGGSWIHLRIDRARRRGASSQASRRAAARGLFEEGVRLLSEQKWAAAADRFERARTLQPSPRITYNLTSALTEMGRFVYASELLRELVNAREIEPALQQAAKQRLDKIQGQIAGLVVMVEGDTTAAEISLDGRVIEMVLLSVPVPVDPGEHRLVVRRAGKEVLTREIRISEGRTRRSIWRCLRDQFATMWPHRYR